MSVGGIDSEEFALRKADVTVVQGFSTQDANPWDIPEGDVYGVETGCIDEYGRTVSQDQNLDDL